MATVSNSWQRLRFVPRADAAVLSIKHPPAPSRPDTVHPIFDSQGYDQPLGPWTEDRASILYPPKTEEYACSTIPQRPRPYNSDRYLRATLAKNERLRLSMLWYYTRDIFDESEFLRGLQEKVLLAQESTGWEYVVIGLSDVNIYIRLATVGLPLGILPRGECICSHTITQPPGSIFLLPNMMEDWRFRESPYVEQGGLIAYAGAPLRLQNESLDPVGLGSLCVASATSQPPLTKSQQSTLVRLADWVVSDIIQCARARRQRARHQMTELLSTAQTETDNASSEEPVLKILRTTYPDAIIRLQSFQTGSIEIEGQESISSSELEDGLWEDIEYLDDYIANSNHEEAQSTRIVRLIASQCESTLGPSLLVVGSKDMRLVFDDVDSWFVQSCAAMLSSMWHKRLLAEALRAKEKFLRGFTHQLRTPIHGILGSVELLAEELKPHHLRESAERVSAFLEAASPNNAGEPSVYIDTIKTAGRDLISIVNSMITLNRWSDIALGERSYDTHSVYDLENGLASEMLKSISGDSRYKASVFFHHNIPATHDSVRTDLSLLQDTLLPLILNAIQNTTEGVVVVTTSLCPESKELIVDVEDTGCGIHGDDQQRIFEPYEKVGVYTMGAGLGLTLASKFATLLHGTVTLVSSEVGRGSHFRARFQDMDASSSSSVKTWRSRFSNIPTKFYQKKLAGSPDTLLYDNLAKVLVCCGLSPSDDAEDCLAILDFNSDPNVRLSDFSRLPRNQIGLCIVPATEDESSPDKNMSNIISARGPFSATLVCSLLEEAKARMSVTKASLATYAEPPASSQRNDDSLFQPEQVGHAITASCETGESTQLIVNLSDDPDAATIASANDNASSLLDVNSSIVVPIFSKSRSTQKPIALLVDDNNVNLRIMQMYCKKRGLPFFCAVDGLQAVDLFSKHQSLAAVGEGQPIELILMDLQMPLCDGIDATKQIRSLEKQNGWNDSIIFIVTGQDSPTDKIDAEGAGADDYYVKPVGIKLLDRGVKRFFPEFEAP